VRSARRRREEHKDTPHLCVPLGPALPTATTLCTANRRRDFPGEFSDRRPMSSSFSSVKIRFIFYRLYVSSDAVSSKLSSLIWKFYLRTVRVLGYRSGGPGSIPGTTRFSGGGEKQVVGLERGPFSLVSTTEELLGRKLAASV
jgi:hypothetical protein